mmetsp:Transcript_5394/g.16325  ORF Transcript_5394/g.16325 Transcript_5394/m.16325 type:complete len:850 (-) Transcript_5394:314-2863(-)
MVLHQEGGLNSSLLGCLHDPLGLLANLLTGNEAGAEGALLAPGRGLPVGAIRHHLPSVTIAQVAREGVAEGLLGLRVLHRGGDLDPPAQVASHPIRRADEVRRIPVVVEHRHAVVLQEAPENADHPDILAHALDPRPQPAHAPNDAVHPDVGLARFVELADEDPVIEAVHLDQYRGVPAGLGVLDLPLDHLHELLPHVSWGHEELPVPPDGVLLVQAREVLEDVHHVPAQLGVAAEEAEVRVQASGHGVVVSRADVNVSLQGNPRVPLPPHHEHALAVSLEADESVGHRAPGRLELLGVRHVPRLVEPRLELHQDGHLLPPLGCLEQGFDHRAVVGRPVDRGLDRQHIRIRRRFLEEPEGRALETLVRVVDQDVAPADRVEDALPPVGRSPLRLTHRGAGRVRAHGDRGVPRVLEFRKVGVRGNLERLQVRQIQKRLDVVDVPLRVELQLVRQEIDQVVWGPLQHLQPHERGEHPFPDFLRDHLQQVLGLILVPLQLGVPRHPVRPGVQDLPAAEELIQVADDELLHGKEGYPPAAPTLASGGLHLDPPVHGRGNGHHGVGDPLRGGVFPQVLQSHPQPDAEGLQEGERVARIHLDWRQEQLELLSEVLGEPLPFVWAQVREPLGDVDALLGQPRLEVGVEDLGLMVGELLHVLRYELELMVWGPNQRVLLLHELVRLAGLQLPLQASHALCEELVQIRCGDAQEEQLLQQRHPLAARLGKHPPVESQPRDLRIVHRRAPAQLLDCQPANVAVALVGYVEVVPSPCVPLPCVVLALALRGGHHAAGLPRALFRLVRLLLQVGQQEVLVPLVDGAELDRRAGLGPHLGLSLQAPLDLPAPAWGVETFLRG